MKHILGLLAGIAALGLMLVGQPQAAASEQQLLVDPAMAQAAAAVVDVTVQSTLNVELDGAPHTVHRVVVDASNLSWVGEEVYVAIPGGLRADGSTVLLSNAAPFLNDGAQVQLAVDVRDDELQDVISQVADDPDAAVFSIVGGENGIAQRSSSRVTALAAGGGFTLSGFERDNFTPPTVFRINPQFSGLSATETITGVRAGFDRWENDAASDIDFTYGGTTGASGLNWGNGVTDVSWQLPSSTNYLDASLAVAHMVIGANGHEFEVIMSRSYAWTNGSSWNTWDLETVVAHEVGHGIGLAHMANDQNQLMYTHIPPATVKPLGPGDLAAAAHLYPNTLTGYVPIKPQRILDTRDTVHGDYSTPWSQNEVRSVQVTGVGNVPASGVSAVAVQLTSVYPTAAASYFTIWGDSYRPNAPSKHYGTAAGGSDGHAAVTNDLVIVPVAAGGSIQGYNWLGQVHIVMDVVGYYTESGGTPYSEVAPARILDTRDSVHGDYSTPWSQNEVRSVQIAGLGGIPTSATAVVMHVTSVNPTANHSFMTVWASGSRPLAASKNYGLQSGGPLGHSAVTNDLIIVPVNANGAVNFYNWLGQVDIVVDVVGYYGPNGDLGFNDMRPARLVDTRNATDGAYSTPWGQNEIRSVQVAGVDAVPATGVSAAVLQITTFDPTAQHSFMTIWGSGSRPLAAAKNFGTNGSGPLGHAATTNETIIVPVGTDGAVQIYNWLGQVDVVVDVVGYYAN